MNMPVLPVTSPSPPPADVPVRGTDAATTDTPAFSNVLSQQRDGATRPADSRRSENASGRADPDSPERHEPIGPDETLSLILNSAALPLMQAAIPTAETRPVHAGSAGRTGAADPRAAHPLIDAAGRAPADARDGTPDTKTAGEAGTNDRILTPRTDAVAATAPATDRGPPQADTAVPAGARESGRARFAALQAQPQATDHSFLAAQAAAGTQAAAGSAARARSAPGLETLQAATSDATLASAAAPAGASLLPAAAPAVASVAVSTPLSNPQWPQDFSRQILQLTQNLTGTGHTVQMHINPPELGPIHITLHVGDSIAQASFVSPHANVRHVLENALPHLEQQLAQAGLSLGQADVGDQQPGQQAYAQGQAPSARDGGAVFSLDGQTAEAASLPATPAAPRAASRPDALVDTFA
ncbi:flagellar hook-length control protein FliK [Castellaniella sp. WN]